MKRKVITTIITMLFLATMLIVPFNVALVSGHSGDVLSDWASVIPIIDGTISPGEWDDADTVTFTIGIPWGLPQESHECILYVKNDKTNLYLAWVIKNEDFDIGDMGRFHFDNDHDGVREVGDDAINCFGSGVCCDDFLLSVDPPLPYYEKHDIEYGGTEDVVGAVSHTNPVTNGIGDYTFEVSHPLDTADDSHDFSLLAGDTVGLDLEFFDPPLGAGVWPAQAWPPASDWADVVIASGVVPADIDVDPDTLNLVGNGPWITAYIEPPSGHDVTDIDVASIELNCDITGGSIPYTAGVDLDAPMEIGDYDGDGIPDLMVKFDRLALVDYLQTSDFDDADGKFFNLPITITGIVAGTPFEGTDTIRVRI